MTLPPKQGWVADEAAVLDLQAGDVDEQAHAQAGGAGGGHVAAVGRAGEEDHRRDRRP